MSSKHCLSLLFFLLVSISACHTPPLMQPAPLVVELPRQLRPLPETLPAGKTEPGFKLRGIKGWMWSPEQYLAEIPVLATYRMNFLMNCYTSMCDIENYRWGVDTNCNRWWEPLPEKKKRAYEDVVRRCALHGIEFCFSMNPNLTSTRFADPESAQDVENLWQHYRWMQDLGVRWFNICLDDISHGIDAQMQAKLVNEIFRRLRARDNDAQMIFGPTYYFGDGTWRGSEPYLKTLARELDKDVYIFWTGDATVTPRITRRAAERYRSIVGHRLIIWDNYPVNDNTPTMHLGPLTGRDPDLCEVTDGYMSNSLCPQNEINRVPILTNADYAYNPWGYEPGRSIGQAIIRMAGTEEQRLALKALVEAYPGMLHFDRWLNYNPVRDRYARLDSLSDGEAKAFVRQMERLLVQFERAFPDRFLDARKTLAADVAWLQAGIIKRDGLKQGGAIVN